MGQHTDADGDGLADRPPATPGRDFTLGVDPVPGQVFHRFEQAPGLGRHVLHDDRSRAFDADVLVRGIVRRQATVIHPRVIPPWDQGETGSCTAHAALGLMMSEPYFSWQAGLNRTSKLYSEDDVLRFYGRETELDDRQIPGSYPAEDTGSTGLWSMKTLRDWKLITQYRHAFSFDTLARLLQVTPVSLGLPWFESMFRVDEDYVVDVRPETGLAGGHQIVGQGIDFERQAIRICNSWGENWAEQGFAWIGFGDMRTLLGLHGDVSVPVIV
jgi:hypothetical protein